MFRLKILSSGTDTTCHYFELFLYCFNKLFKESTVDLLTTPLCNVYKVYIDKLGFHEMVADLCHIYILLITIFMTLI